MLDWRKLKVGDQVLFTVNEFDCKYSEIMTVTDVCDDHIIVGADPTEHNWIDDDFAYMISQP